MRKITRRTIIAGVVTIVVFSGASVAFAYWTAGGTGTGTAAAGTNAPVVAVQTTVVSDISPGLAAQTISGNFTNGNTTPTYVTSVTASISSVAKAVGAPAGTCDSTDFTLASSTMTVGSEVPVGTAQGAWTGATLAFNNKATNQDACKGAVVNLSYAVS